MCTRKRRRRNNEACKQVNKNEKKGATRARKTLLKQIKNNDDRQSDHFRHTLKEWQKSLRKSYT
jgi:hypothetical protein